MFGYVRPLIPELKVRELERFRAMYCGMCHELRRSYGPEARLILNYDFVFLAMLLSDGTAPNEYELRRCPVSPVKKRCVCKTCGSLTKSAGYSVILTYRKLCDTEKDGGFFERLGAAAAKAGLHGAYKKAASQWPEFDAGVTRGLGRLDALEKSGEASIDRPADTFAGLLSSACDDRVRRELMYHLGRVIYVADAWDDLEEDLKTGSYNPIVRRFGVTEAPASDEVREAVGRTLRLSASAMMADFELLPKTYWEPILRNIIFEGIPDMIEKILIGEWNTAEKPLKERYDERPV